jgi:tRNA(Ile)-lysidine synthase
MINKLHDIIVHKNLCTKEDIILIGASGGVDSMVLCHILLSLGYKIAVGHVNYKMRSQESDLDEALVSKFALDNHIPFHTTLMPDELKHKKNFQNQARIFRYAWFEELCEKNAYSKIATAHHLNDEIESFFLHLFRASGISGLAGINENLYAKIIRPLLSFSKEDIYKYASLHDVSYREDSSNKESKYLRNKIRNNLVPLLQDMDEGAIRNISKSIQYLKETDVFLNALANESQLISKSEESTILNVESLGNYENPAFILFYYAKPYGFNREQTDAVWYSSENGAKCLNKNYQLSKDRAFITIKPIGCTAGFEMCIPDEGTYLVNNQSLTFTLIERNEIEFNKHTEYLGFQSHPFPLTVRSRKQGDTFSPLGMKGLKKSLKKFMIDEKMDAMQKENIVVIEHNGEICYVAPYRISESFKVIGENSFILKIEIN